jgi:selenide,water dikinase
MPAGALAQVLCHLPAVSDPDLLIGCDAFADAGVYRLRSDLALVQTLDFFTPVVDDPFTFGQIAAANALSDVYTMGAEPKLVMNIVCFPSKSVDIKILAEIIKGGADKVAEAGAIIVGGHSVEDKEPKYGLSVTGLVHPDKLVTNRGAQPGDVLVLTKPVGTGLVMTAVKAGMDRAGELDAAIASMTTLNKAAAAAMLEVGVSSATDITGFGLLGHAREMALASKVAMEISFNRVPLLPGAVHAAGMGLIPGGAYANREYVACGLETAGAVGEREIDILCDPQTSGGLLMAVPQDRADALLGAMQRRHVPAAVIGHVVRGAAGSIRVTL